MYLWSQKYKNDVGKCIGGEVGGFKHLHMERQQPNRPSRMTPVVRMTLNV